MGCFLKYSLFVFYVFMHGDLDQRILEKTKEIELHPGEAHLYLDRGQLYMQHEDYARAKTDFSFCMDHALINTDVLIGLSESLFCLNQPDSAFIYVEQALDIEPDHFSALELKSLILNRLERYCEAAHTLQHLLSISTDPTPLLFLRASTYMSSCTEKGSDEIAVDIVKDGLNRLGEIHSLEKQLICLYRQMNRNDEAILVQTSIIDQAELKVRPYYERANLYAEMKNTEKAKEDLVIAFYLLEQLPANKKNIPSMITLKGEMNALFNELNL
jgi:tetratricopeptide (TPR) repeat protein